MSHGPEISIRKIKHIFSGRQQSVYIYHTANHAVMQALCIICLCPSMSILVTVGLWWWKPLGGPVSLGTLASC